MWGQCSAPGPGEGPATVTKGETKVTGGVCSVCARAKGRSMTEVYDPLSEASGGVYDPLCEAPGVYEAPGVVPIEAGFEATGVSPENRAWAKGNLKPTFG